MASPRTVYGYLKGGFAMMDLLSWLSARSGRDQTKRMREFMISYMSTEERAATIAVQLWRHTLMHTGSPRTLRGRTSGLRFLWLLHWSEHLGREGHMKIIRRAPNEEVLKLGLLYFLVDLQQAALKMFADQDTRAAQKQVEETWAAILAKQSVDL